MMSSQIALAWYQGVSDEFTSDSIKGKTEIQKIILKMRRIPEKTHDPISKMVGSQSGVIRRMQLQSTYACAI